MICVRAIAATALASAMAAVVALSTASIAAAADTAPNRSEGMLSAIDVEQRLGTPLPLDARVRDSSGRQIAFGDVLADRPLIVAFVYFDCPMLCSLVLEGLVKSLRPLSFEVGRDFDVAVVSFDASESPEQASAAKQRYVERYGREGTENGWHFLTAGAEAIERLTDAAGFRFAYDDVREEFAHAAAIMVATDRGRLARYFFGVEYAPRDVRLALVEASERRLGSVVEQLLLYCYHYDPSAGRYTASVMNIVRLAGGATVVAMVLGFALLRRREHPSC